LEQRGPIKSNYGLDQHGITGAKSVSWNLDTPALYEEAIIRREGRLAPGGAFVVETGEYTGRSPKDKFLVEEPSSKDEIWWGSVNKPISAANYKKIREKFMA